MQVLNHDEKTIVLIKDHIFIEGIQCTIGELDHIITKFGYSQSLKDIIESAYTGTSTLDEISKFIASNNTSVRKIIATHGGDCHRDVLVYDDMLVVLLAVAEHGNDVHRDLLVNSDSDMVCMAVARYGNDIHRDQLLYSPSTAVLATVARYGSLEHRNKLIRNSNKLIQRAITEAEV